MRHIKGNRLVSSTDYLDVFRPHIIHQLISQNYKRFVKHLHTLVNLQTFSKDQILKYIYFFTSNAKIVKQVPRQWGKSLYGEKSLVTQLRKNCFVNILCTLNFAQKYRLRNRGMYCLLLDIYYLMVFLNVRYEFGPRCFIFYPLKHSK